MSILTQYIELVFEMSMFLIDNSIFFAYGNFHNLRSAGETCLPINSIARMSFTCFLYVNRLQICNER